MTELETFPSAIPGRHYEEIDLDPEAGGIIGEGGESLVYLVKAIEAGEEVGKFALKQCTERKQSGSSSGWSIIRRFKRQSEFMDALKHPNIVDFVELVETEGRYVNPHLVMEYVEGQDLGERLKQGHLKPEEFTSIAQQVIAAISHAHSQTNAAGERSSIIHRDLKPAQVMIQPDGLVKLLDFGAGKQLGDQTQYTVVSTGGATYDYAAPEHFGIFEHSTATDVYGMGLLLYEMITGKPMPRGDDHKHTLNSAKLGRYRDIIAMATQHEPENRATLEQVASVINDRTYELESFQPDPEGEMDPYSLVRAFEREGSDGKYFDWEGHDDPATGRQRVVLMLGRKGGHQYQFGSQIFTEGKQPRQFVFTYAGDKTFRLPPGDDEDIAFEEILAAHETHIATQVPAKIEEKETALVVIPKGVPERYAASGFNRGLTKGLGFAGFLSVGLAGAAGGAAMGYAFLAGNPVTAVLGIIIGGILGGTFGAAGGAYTGITIANAPSKALEMLYGRKETRALAEPDESLHTPGFIETALKGKFYSEIQAFRAEHDTELARSDEEGFNLEIVLDNMERLYGEKARRVFAHNYAHKVLQKENIVASHITMEWVRECEAHGFVNPPDKTTYQEIVKVAEHALGKAEEKMQKSRFKGRKAKKEAELLENICLGLLSRGALSELAEIRERQFDYQRLDLTSSMVSKTSNALEVLIGKKTLDQIDEVVHDILISKHHDLYGQNPNERDVQQYAAACRAFGLEPNLEKCERALVPAPVDQAQDIAAYQNNVHKPEFASMERLGVVQYLQGVQKEHGTEYRQELARAYAAEKLETGEYDKVIEVIQYSLDRPGRETKEMPPFQQAVHVGIKTREEAPLIEELLYGLLNKGAWGELYDVLTVREPGEVVYRDDNFWEKVMTKKGFAQFEARGKEILEEMISHLENASLDEINAYQKACGEAFFYQNGSGAAGLEKHRRIIEK